MSTSIYGVSAAINGGSDSNFGVTLLLTVKPKLESVTALLESAPASNNGVGNSIFGVDDSNFIVSLIVS